MSISYSSLFHSDSFVNKIKNVKKLIKSLRCINKQIKIWRLTTTTRVWLFMTRIAKKSYAKKCIFISCALILNHLLRGHSSIIQK